MKGVFFKAVLVICTAVSCFAVSKAVIAANINLKATAPTDYTVVKGDTLWDISALYLDNPWLWPKLWQANPAIHNPHLIYPGDKLILSWHDGQPSIRLKTATNSESVQTQSQAVPTLAKSLLLPYLEHDRLVSAKTLQAANRIIGSENGRHFLTTQDKIYIEGDQQSHDWGIYREIETHQRNSPDHIMTSLKLVALATKVEQPSKAQHIKTDQPVTTLEIVKQTQEAKVGDIVLSQDLETIESFTFFPSPAPAPKYVSPCLDNCTAPEIVGMFNNRQLAVQNDVVIINRGKQDKLLQGSMYHIEPTVDLPFAEEQAKPNQIKPPVTAIGQLIVVRTYDYFSVAMITQSSKPIDRSVRLISPLNTVVER